MATQPKNRGNQGIIRIVILCCVLLTMACSLPVEIPPLQPPPTQTPEPTQIPYPKAEIVFNVSVESTQAPNSPILLELLDEVTGLGLNPTRFEMQAVDARHYSYQGTFPVGSILKYRYLRTGSPPAIEYTSQNSQVRYRLYHVEGPGIVKDIVAAWNDQQFSQPVGRIRGQVVDANSNAPLPAILVTAGGAVTYSASDGSFLLEGLPPGTHQLVAYDPDGKHQVFQQGALVDVEATTPAEIRLPPVPMVKLIFNVTIPKSDIAGLPVRMIGNLYSLGNTYADLRGGFSTIATRAPLLQQVSDTHYVLTLTLPSGFDLRYKYSLGDGFWNSEQTSTGKFRIRQLIVPAQDTTIDDVVTTWQTAGYQPVFFNVQVPSTTLATDSISIQFNPFGWSEPLPMWPLGNNQWMYVLYSPLNLSNTVGYRYCRNEQCGSADDLATPGNQAAGYPFNPSLIDQTMKDEVKNWNWWNGKSQPTTVVADPITRRDANFIAGIELLPAYDPSWQKYYDPTAVSIAADGANWVFLTPTWTYTRNSPPVIEPNPGLDPMWGDMTNTIQTFQQRNLQVAVFPSVAVIDKSMDQWWLDAPRDAGWWQTWFDRYTTYLLNFADLSEQQHVSALILGGPSVSPALPDGTLSSGDSSGVPADSQARWEKLIQTIRERYKGKLLWALTYPAGIKSAPPWLNQIDGVYILWSNRITKASNASQQDLTDAIGSAMDKDIQDFATGLNKPVTIGIGYPSATGAAVGCVRNKQAKCISFALLSRPNEDQIDAQLNLSEQATIYNAFLNAINTRDWISGFVSRGFYPPVPLQDKSMSIYGKPAEDIIWYWFPRMVSK